MDKTTKAVVEELFRLAHEHGAKLAVRADAGTAPLRDAEFKPLMAKVFDPTTITVLAFEHAERRADVVRRFQAAADSASQTRQNIAVPDVDAYVLLVGRHKFKCYAAGDRDQFVTMLDERAPACELCRGTTDQQSMMSHSCGAWLCTQCIVELMADEVNAADRTPETAKIGFLCPRCRGALTATVQPDGRGVEIGY